MTTQHSQSLPLARHIRPLATQLILFMVVFSTAGPLFAAEGDTRTWKGTWLNRRFNTNGPLECVAVEGEDGNWKATFSGKFQGETFSYDVEFSSKKKKSQLELSGTAKVQQFEYEWIGSIKGKTLTGEYKANNGFNGSFTLKEERKKK